MNVRALMAQAVRCNGDRIAVIHGDRRLTFSEAWDRGVRLANALIALGLQPGDRVAVLEDNCIEAADFIQACAIANLVRVPLHARNAPEAHQHMIGHTGCKALSNLSLPSSQMISTLSATPAARPARPRQPLSRTVPGSTEYATGFTSFRRSFPGTVACISDRSRMVRDTSISRSG